MAESILISDYTYDLPDDRIAYRPLAERDQSRLLIYKDGHIEHKQFFQLADTLPPEALLFFNNTKVIPARLQFEKDTGARIEVFLLQPERPSNIVALAMMSTQTATWKCTIGNLKRWPANTVLKQTRNEITLHANLLDREEGLVELTWTPADRTLSEVVQAFGATPLPPYIKRASEEEDRERYQTVYARHDGAVAAPTAGLHFTPRVLNDLKKRGIATDFLTLHVGAGTFQPVKTENALDHTMHEEQLVITQQNIENLLARPLVIPVGTTSMRVLESIYWYGVKLNTNSSAPFHITQNDPYEMPASLTRDESLRLVLKRMKELKTENLSGATSIYIRPGYDFKICRAIVTNFHQPGSTLILLVAALVGEDWRTIYAEAIKNGYRFLSYGDGSVLWRRFKI